MRDANTRVYRFVIEDPPPRVVPEPAPEPVAEAPAIPEPAPLVPRRVTPGRLATPQRPLPRIVPRTVPAATGSIGVVHVPGDRLLVVAGLLLGLGIGGSIDGTAFHQLVQYHADGTPAALVGVKTVPLWDSLLHAFTWLATLIGLGVLWKVVRRPGVSLRTSWFVGSLLLGWGFFNGIEGAIDHHLLQLHHAHPDTAQLLWDGGLITSGVVLILVGALCIGLGRR